MRQGTQYEYNRKSKIIRQFFSEEARDLGQASGFVQRASKMSADVFAQTLILGSLDKPEATLNELVQVSAELGVDISEPGLHQQMNVPAARFLKLLLEVSLQQFIANGPVPRGVLERFERVDILDSTQVALPTHLADEFAGFNTPTSAAVLKIQLSFDYLRGRLNALHLGAGRESDQRCDLAAQLATPGSLQLFDMGYVQFDRLQRITAREAYYITRMKTTTQVYLQPEDTQAINLVTWLEVQGGDTVDQWVYIDPAAHLRVRLLAQRVPPEVAAVRRRKAQRTARKKQRGISQRHLALQAWELIITTVPDTWLSLEQVFALYRLRWQIELLFKLCKSQFRLAALSSSRRERTLCQLYARLIGLVLFQWLIAPWRFLDHAELSPTKAHRVVQRQARAFLQALADPLLDLPGLLADISRDFLRFALKSPRKKSPSTLARLELLGV
jgi:hypothetical protein